MIYYIGLISVILFLYCLSKLYSNRINQKKFFLLFSCLSVIIFQGLRDFSVGVDLQVYIPAFNNIGKSVSLTFKSLVYNNFEPGYIVYNKIVYLLGFDERAFLFITVIIIQVPIFYTIYKYSEKELISVLTYFAIANFIMTFSGLRQAMAMSMCFFAYKYILDKKFVHYIVIIVIAALFHTSALLCLILYPLYYFKIDAKRVFIAIGIIFTFVFFKTYIIKFAGLLYYGKAIEFEETNAYLMFIFYFIIYIVSYLYKGDDCDYLGLRNILFLIILIYTLAPLSNTITRAAYPLILYMTLFIPKILTIFKVKPSNVLLDIFWGAFCIIYFISQLGYLDTLPFSFL